MYKYRYIKNQNERRLTYNKIYNVDIRFHMINMINGIEVSVEYIQVRDNVGDLSNYAVSYDGDVWFQNIAEIREEFISNLID